MSEGSCCLTLKIKRSEQQGGSQERNFIDRERLSRETHSRVWKPGTPWSWEGWASYSYFNTKGGSGEENLCSSLAWGVSAFLGDVGLIYVIETATNPPYELEPLTAIREMGQQHSVCSYFLLRGGEEGPPAGVRDPNPRGCLRVLCSTGETARPSVVWL
jgi:hypothetical protein